MPSPSSPRTRMPSIRFAGYMLLGTVGATLRAQALNAASDGFDPNANGIVNALAIQPDGKILMAGYFTQLHPYGYPVSGHAYIARLNHNGSVDESFSPNANGVVRTMALQPNGQIILGGSFHDDSAQRGRCAGHPQLRGPAERRREPRPGIQPERERRRLRHRVPAERAGRDRRRHSRPSSPTARRAQRRAITSRGSMWTAPWTQASIPARTRRSFRSRSSPTARSS